jgi:hypothetical protein
MSGLFRTSAFVLIAAIIGGVPGAPQGSAEEPAGITVGPQYRTTHVHLAPNDFNTFAAGIFKPSSVSLQ